MNKYDAYIEDIFKEDKWLNSEITWLKIDSPKSPKDIKSYLKLANITIGITKKINWFQKLMYKLFFEIEIKKLENKDES